MLIHPIAPVYDSNSRILILGSFPSVRSREIGFFYGHPHNRFWRVLSLVFDEEIPKTIEEKKTFLKRNHVALWDVIGSCDIEGSSDASIRNVVPNDLNVILNNAQIRAVFCNGKTAFRLYQKHVEPITGRKAICLPSTSPANAAWSLERLLGEWKCIRDGMI